MALADYAESELGKIFDYLAYSAVDMSIPVDETLEFMGLSTEADVTSSNLVLAHKILRVMSFRKALVDLSIDFNFSADGSSYNYDKQKDIIEKLLEDAITDANNYIAVTEKAFDTIELKHVRHLYTSGSCWNEYGHNYHYSWR